MTTKGRKVNDHTRFEGNGISYRAKLIGIEDVPEARGDQMCQDALIKLKNAVKISGEHKRKIFVNVTLEGLKIIDAISLIVLHTHAVHRISFISRDTSDNRAFGYIFGQEDGSHKFFAIKTAAAAEQLVLALRDLFQVVYEMKKQEMDDAKVKLETGEVSATTREENSQTSGDGSTSGSGQTLTEKASADSENIYQVPTNNAPVNPEAQAEQVANLLELEDQADHILKDIEHIKNLEFDTVSNESAPTSAVSSPPTSPMAKLTPPSSTAASADPWGLLELSSPTTQSTAPQTTALGDLAGLSSASFTTIGQQPFGQQSFAGTPFSMQSAYGGAGLGINMLTGGLPVTKDPFANDPFGAPAQQQQQPRMPAAGGFGAANPFGGGFGQPFGMQPGGQQPGVQPGAQPGGMVPGMMPGMVPHGMMSPQAYGNPFGGMAAQPQMSNPFGGNDDNVLKPVRKDGDPNAASEDSSRAAAKSPRPDLFGDLVDIKRSASPTAKSPKDMFKQINSPDKKPMNAMKNEAAKPPAMGSTSQATQASDSECDPFGEQISMEADRTRGLLPSEDGEEDPFDVSHIPPSLAEPFEHNTHIVCSNLSHVTNPPPVPARHPSFPGTEDISLSSPNMPPSIPPPPAPSLSAVSATPPLPSRTPTTPKILKDVNANTFTLPSDLSISQSSPADSSFMLPSPDEPPPPLPSHLTHTSPPPPPPRPNVKSTTLPTSPVPKGQEDANDKSLNSVSSSFKSNRLSPNLSVSVIQGAKQDQHAESQLKSSTKFQSTSDNSDALSEVRDICSDTNFPQASPSHVSQGNPEVNADGSENSSVLSQSKQSWVNFDQADSDSFVFEQSVISEESDPFNMPVHLTPGFKAVAKYGNDPFDDSINSMLSSSTEAWDPFSDQTNAVSSPFGDPFGAPPQPQSVNGNDKPLLD